MISRHVEPLSQKSRPTCSLPLNDADLSLGNANWTKGLQSMSDWIWSGNLNPERFPNHLARFFLQVPGIFEQQLNFSTTLIFDEPSFRNGNQVSGFLPRVARELVISYIGQLRRAWYTMTHHAVLGRLTCIKHGLSEQEFTEKWYHLIEFEAFPEHYTDIEREMLVFARAFATNPKSDNYSDLNFADLKLALKEENRRRYPQSGLWMKRLQAARFARAEALAQGLSTHEVYERSREASEDVEKELPDDLNEQLVNAQVVELAFLCLQFVALTDVFSALNIPDENFLADTLTQLVPPKVVERINELNSTVLRALELRREARDQGREASSITPEGMPILVPPSVDPPLKPISDRKVNVAPAPLTGARVPLTPYEGKDKDGNYRPAFLGAADADKGLTVGGIQVGTYGWGFGGHFPGSLVYALMHHPELARFEAPYSLPVLFNEDEWRNGVQTSGFVSRLLKELVIQKVYKVTRSRYGIEHHTMFLYNAYLDEYGVGRAPHPSFTGKERQHAVKVALKKASDATMYMHQHKQAPPGVYTDAQCAALDWTEQIVRAPHMASESEGELREKLDQENRDEIQAGLRCLDTGPGIGAEAALQRLLDHQVAELAMMIGHMDGLGRAMTMLQLEAERPVQMVKGTWTENGGIDPELDKHGQVQFTGYFNNRPGLHDIFGFIGIPEAVRTTNELMANPQLCELIQERLKTERGSIDISADEACTTAEF